MDLKETTNHKGKFFVIQCAGYTIDQSVDAENETKDALDDAPSTS